MGIQGTKRISYEERKSIELFIKRGYTVLHIADELQRPFQTIYRELKRGQINGTYCADYAQFSYAKRNDNVGRTCILKLNPQLANYIAKLILEKHLSPAEIIKQLRVEKIPEAPTSKNTIYSAINNNLIPGVTRDTLLAKRRQTHMFSNGLIKIPQWICEKLNLNDYESLDVEVIDDKIIICKSQS